MVCNPYGCSNDKNKVTFGFWDTVQAFNLDKDNQNIDMDNVFALEHE